ncbi:MAG: rRNA maturation RNase YbeY [Candidatus Krumholzibacteriota bacterium]|nr:rRNA maturation RNase YbeY [Candidatus Krumholzibacteriota bacterium]
MRAIINSHHRVTGRKEFNRCAGEIESIASSFSSAKSIIGINLIGERKMAWLNRSYKGRKGPAEILTFNYSDGDVSSSSDEEISAEIFLCWKPVLNGAKIRRVPARAYLLRLIVHGLCHLEGYRHGSEESEIEMEDAEMMHLRKILPMETVDRLFE